MTGLFVFGLTVFVLGLAAAGGWTLIESARRERRRLRQVQIIRRAEARIDEIGRKTEAELVTELLRQLDQQRRPDGPGGVQ